MDDFVSVAKASDLSDGDMIMVRVGEEEILLANVGGSFFAIGDECPHSGGSLSGGYLEEGEVECPLHGSLFNVKTGENTGPPASENVPRFQVRVEGDDIQVGPAA